MQLSSESKIFVTDTAVEIAILAKGYLIWFLKFHHTQLHLGFKNIQEQLTWQTTNVHYKLSVLIFLHLAMVFYHTNLFKQYFSTGLSCFFSQWHYPQKVLDKMIVSYLCFSYLGNQQHSKIVACCNICTYCW